ncbi:MAG TPA: hypothetical protein VMX97_01615 [Hyphomicrobiaceae bacterium]|nr:hypothetical protein [Hyphomicrobiaceae bacterium]
MHIQTSRLGFRICATLLGIGYGIVGVYVIGQSSIAPSPELSGRAFWMGVTFIIASVVSISVTWLVSDLSNIWCLPPRKTKPKREK